MCFIEVDVSNKCGVRVSCRNCANGQTAVPEAALELLDREAGSWALELEDAVKARNMERLLRLHHRMKGPLGQLGLWRLDQAVGRLREAMDPHDAERVEELRRRSVALIGELRQLTGVNRASTSSR